MSMNDERLNCAASFVARLFTLSRGSPKAWLRADVVGQSAGIVGPQLEQAVADAVQAGLVDRCVDDNGLVLLTDRGRALAEGIAS